MRVVVLNFYMIVIIFLILYINKKTFCSFDSFKIYIGFNCYPSNMQNDEIQDNVGLWDDQQRKSRHGKAKNLHTLCFYFYFPSI